MISMLIEGVFVESIGWILGSPCSSDKISSPGAISSAVGSESLDVFVLWLSSLSGRDLL